jgi:hypothetical protein
MVGVFARRISYSLYFVILLVCLVLSASLGAYAANRETFAHMSDEIYAFTGANVVRLTNAELQKLGNPARVDCGAVGCINGIETDGKIICYETASRIFGAGTCTKISRVIEEKKGSYTEHGYKCESKVPEGGCKTKDYWAGSSGGLAGAQNAAIKEADKCCPGGTKVKKGGDGYYCEEG